MPESSPGRRPCNASRNSGRNVAGSILPRKPPSIAVASVDFSRARTAKSAPFFNCCRLRSASLAESTTNRRTATVAATASASKTPAAAQTAHFAALPPSITSAMDQVYHPRRGAAPCAGVIAYLYFWPPALPCREMGTRGGNPSREPRTIRSAVRTSTSAPPCQLPCGSFYPRSSAFICGQYRSLLLALCRGKAYLAADERR